MTQSHPDPMTDDEIALRQDLRVARERLDDLVEELRVVDTELENLAEERTRYALVETVCSSLSELETLGASDLFWAGRQASTPHNSDSYGPSDDSGAAHLRLVRSRIDEFEKSVHEVDERRQSLLDELQYQEDAADYIASSVLEAERLEEERKREWLIERDEDDIPIRLATMPWVRGLEDDRRFQRTLAGSLLAALLLSIVLPLIDIPLPARWEVLEEQDRLTQLIREELPPPPPVVELVERAPVEVEKDMEQPSEVEEPVAAEELLTEAAPKPKAESKGILAFRDKFSALAEEDPVERLGSNARISNPGELAQGAATRSMVTSRAAGTSGGINIASLSRDTGGSGQNLGGVDVTQATSSIGTGSGNGKGDRPLAGGGPGLGRTDEEIQIVFDRHKAALYRMYNRELRKNPTLRGQIVLRLTIEPDGSVSMSELKSTDMKSPSLTKQVVDRVRTFDFGAKEGVSAITIVYPIDFLPAT